MIFFNLIIIFNSLITICSHNIDNNLNIYLNPISFQKKDTSTHNNNVLENNGIDTTQVSTNNKKNTVVIKGKTLFGIASFYSAHLDGTITATGETFKHNKLTAASNHIRLNSIVKVTNLRNKKTVIVRINDRMHPRMAAKGRVVDLSLSAAKRLSFIKAGLTRVSVQIISWPKHKRKHKKSNKK